VVVVVEDAVPPQPVTRSTPAKDRAERETRRLRSTGRPPIRTFDPGGCSDANGPMLQAASALRFSPEAQWL